MKLRTGFVSNSSSSSFIQGLAVVTDVDKVKKWMDETGIDLDMELMSNLAGKWDAPNIAGSEVYMDDFNGGRLSINIEQIDLDLPDDMRAKALLAQGDNPFIVWFSDSGGDPSYDEEYGEYDYDVGLDFFDNKSVRLYEAFTKGIPGTVGGQATYGAGRDG